MGSALGIFRDPDAVSQLWQVVYLIATTIESGPTRCST
jgi:hypothetical protein